MVPLFVVLITLDLHPAHCWCNQQSGFIIQDTLIIVRICIFPLRTKAWGRVWLTQDGALLLVIDIFPSLHQIIPDMNQELATLISLND